MKYLLIILSIVATSMFFFPFEFTFLKGINTKHILFGFGSLCFAWDIIRQKDFSISKELLISSFIALVFSLVGQYSNYYNNTADYSYSIYIGSMWMWFIACYGTCCFIRFTHGYISIKLITNYLAVVCVTQCVLALAIDFIPTFKSFVDSVFITADLILLEKIKRLYGIGATLDVAGIRFACVLVMISVYLSEDKEVRTNPIYRLLYLFSFLLISIVGNMIARTTSVGLVIGLIYIVLKSGLFSFTIKLINLHFLKTIAVIIVIGFTVVWYFYTTNIEVFKLVRFAFEGFFNLIETGEWKTDSNEVLKQMWIPPDNNKTWIIGDGYFNDPNTGNYYKYTDIGYLRFIYYSGLIGLTCFSLFFIYLSISLAKRFSYLQNILFLLLIIVFINWVKVSTDIFLVFAFFLVISQPGFIKHYRKDFEKI